MVDSLYQGAVSSGGTHNAIMSSQDYLSQVIVPSILEVVISPQRAQDQYKMRLPIRRMLGTKILM